MNLHEQALQYSIESLAEVKRARAVKQQAQVPDKGVKGGTSGETFTTFVQILMLSAAPDEEPEKSKAKAQEAQFLKDLENVAADFGGSVAIASADPDGWYIVEGGEFMFPPDHLQERLFPFDCFVLFLFPSLESAQQWWISDALNDLYVKKRRLYEKMTVHLYNGLRKMDDQDKWLYLELLCMDQFRGTQKYLDLYKRLFAKAVLEIGIDSHLLYADTPDEILLNESSLDAVIASTWRLKTDPTFWHASLSYTQHLRHIREQHARSLILAIPFEDKSDQQGMQKFYDA